MFDDPDKVAEIFEHKFDLKLLYPEREVFHVSEVTAFLSTIGVYFCMKKDYDQALNYYDALVELAPDHIGTQRLKEFLTTS